MPQFTSKNFSGIFISYRRDDSSGHAGRLFDRLSAHFGDEQVFMDIDHIEPGEDFVQVIEEAVGACEIVVAIIGQNWQGTRSEPRRLLDNPNDFVRLEIAAALARKVGIIPVLVQGADMPHQQELPKDLLPLLRLNALHLRDLSWKHDMDQLIAALERVRARHAAERVRQSEAEAKQKKIATLHHNAEEAVVNKDWDGAIDALNQILVLDSTYAGAPEMLADAQKRLQVSKLYNTGLDHLKGQRWSEALSYLKQVQAEEPDYEDVSVLIETAQRSLDKEEAEARRRAADEAARLKLAAEQEAARRAEDERLRLKREREHELEQAAIRRGAERKAERDRVAAEARQREREQQELKKKEQEEAIRVAKRNRLQAEEELRKREQQEEAIRVAEQAEEELRKKEEQEEAIRVAAQAEKELRRKKEQEEAIRVAGQNRLKAEEWPRSRAAAEALQRERERQELRKKEKQQARPAAMAALFQQNEAEVKRLAARDRFKAEEESRPRMGAEARLRAWEPPPMDTEIAPRAFGHTATDQTSPIIETGCTVTLLTIGIAFCGLAVYIFYRASFATIGGSLLSIWAISAMGIIGLLIIVLGIRRNSKLKMRRETGQSRPRFK